MKNLVKNVNFDWENLENLDLFGKTGFGNLDLGNLDFENLDSRNLDFENLGYLETY